MEKELTVTPEEYKALKEKAAKWDRLEEEIGVFYDESDEDNDGLISIGETAARAFGSL